MNRHHRRHRPRWLRPRTPIFWWLLKPSYVWFIFRELTSLGVAYASLLMIVQIAALGAGAEAHRRFEAFLAHPAAIVLHTLLVVVLLFHTFTWLHLAPKAMVVRLGRRRVPAGALLAGHYVGWIAASALILYLLTGG
jgi:fumarate reductase subunit C